MTAPESRAPREGRTGEARPDHCTNPKCGHERMEHALAGGRCWNVYGGEDGPMLYCDCEGYQPPAPPSVGDATPDGERWTPEAAMQRHAERVAARMAEHGAPSAPPAALPPIPEGHPHREALYSILARRDYQHYRVLPDCVPGFPDAARVRQTIAALEASFAALTPAPSVVADAGAGDARDGVGMVWDAARAVRDQVWQLRAELDEARSALDAATRRAEAAEAEAKRLDKVLDEIGLAGHRAMSDVEHTLMVGKALDDEATARAALAPSRAVPTEDRT